MTTDEWDRASVGSEWSVLSKHPDGQDDVCSVSSATLGSEWSVLSSVPGSIHSVRTLSSVRVLDAAGRRDTDDASVSERYTCDIDCQSDAGSVCTERGWPRLAGTAPPSETWEAVNRASYMEALLQGMDHAPPVTRSKVSVLATRSPVAAVPAARGVATVVSSTSVIAGRLVLDRPRTSVQIRMRGMRGKTLKAMALIDEMMEGGANDGDAGDVWGQHDESSPLWLSFAAHDDRSGGVAQAAF